MNRDKVGAQHLKLTLEALEVKGSMRMEDNKLLESIKSHGKIPGPQNGKDPQTRGVAFKTNTSIT